MSGQIWRNIPGNGSGSGLCVWVRRESLDSRVTERHECLFTSCMFMKKLILSIYLTIVVMFWIVICWLFDWFSLWPSFGLNTVAMQLLSLLIIQRKPSVVSNANLDSFWGQFILNTLAQLLLIKWLHSNNLWKTTALNPLSRLIELKCAFSSCTR